MALHPLGRQIRHRHLGFDARTRPSRSLPAFGHDPQGCSKRVFKTWLASQPDTWRERIEIVAMDGFTGFKKAQPPKNSPARGRSWIPSTSHTLPGMLSMNVAGAFSKSFTIGVGVPSSLTEIITLGRTLKRRAGDILAYFDHPHTSNGPTEAINGRLEHLGGCALGFAKPHQLHHPSTPRNRRIQTPTTPPIMKSQLRRPRRFAGASLLYVDS